MLLERYESAKELKYNNNILEKLSNTDALTGIPNRRFFDKTFLDEWNRAIRNVHNITLMLIDIDNFMNALNLLRRF